MTPRQQAMYWAEWSKLRDVLRGKGKSSAECEAARAALTLKALGRAKSSKDFSNADLDAVLAAIKAQTSPADFDAQMRLQDAPDQRRAALMARARTACARMAESGGKYSLLSGERAEAYIARVARQMFRAEPEACTEGQLMRVAIQLEEQAEREVLALGEHAFAVRDAAEAAKGSAGRLEPGEDF